MGLRGIMMENDKNPSTIDEYISQFPDEIQDRLRSIRTIIREAAPDAGEKISWKMPTFTLNGNLVHFAAHKSHIGFYPGAEGIEAFQDRLSEYKFSKGAVQLPNDRLLPLELVREITAFRVSQNQKPKKPE